MIGMGRGRGRGGKGSGIGSGSCNICEKEAIDPFSYRCKDHYCCDFCQSKENLIHWKTQMICKPCNEQRLKDMIDQFKGNTSNTLEVVCPYCGKESPHDWSDYEDIGTKQCRECFKYFLYEREVHVTYSTSKMDEKSSRKLEVEAKPGFGPKIKDRAKHLRDIKNNKTP